MNIRFNISLKNEDWMQAMGGWRCDALLIPGTKLESIFFDGKKADTKNYEVESHIIRWSETARPNDLIATISLVGELPKLEQEKLRIEREKINLEHKKAYLENRWKIIAAIGAVLSSLLTFGATYFLTPRSPNSTTTATPQTPWIQTFTKPLVISEDQCLQSVENSLTNNGFEGVKPVTKGVYATRENYNVFVSCNGSIKAIFLTVSGSENSKTKDLRDEVSSFLP